MYDFKPAFPPYDKHKLEELLLMPPTTTHRTELQGGDNSESSSDNNTDNNSEGTTTTTDEVDEEVVVHQTLWEEGDLLHNIDADDKNNKLQGDLIEDDDVGQGGKMNDNNHDGVDVASMNDDDVGGGSTIDTDDNAHIQTSDSDNAKVTDDNDKERPQQQHHRDIDAKLDDGNIAIPATRPQDANDATATAAPPVGPLPDPIDDIPNLDDSSEQEEDSVMGSNTAVGEGENEEDNDSDQSIQNQHAEDETTEESAGRDGGITSDGVNGLSESNSSHNEGAGPTLVDEEEKEKEERINDDNGSTMEHYSEDETVEDVAVVETIDTDEVNELLEGNSDDNEGGDTTLVEEDEGENDDRKMDQDTKQDLEIEIDATDATMSTEDESSMESSLEETKTTEADEEQKINIQYDDPLPPTSSPSSSSPSSNNKDANREFVTGLDDVDKLFESVEVPDELDVGADGSSMQDVLVGQALKIITKKVKSLGGAIKVKFDKVATPVKKALPQLGLFGDDEDEDETDVDALFESIVNGNGNVVDPMDAADDDEDGGELSKKLNEKLKVLSEKMKLQQLREKVKSVKELQLFKSEEAQKVFGFTKRKWSQGKDLVNDLLSIFDSDDEDEDDFDLNDIQSLIR
jgi:hypothetical protein